MWLSGREPTCPEDPQPIPPFKKSTRERARGASAQLCCGWAAQKEAFSSLAREEGMPGLLFLGHFPPHVPFPPACLSFIFLSSAFQGRRQRKVGVFWARPDLKFLLVHHNVDDDDDE